MVVENQSTVASMAPGITLVPGLGARNGVMIDQRDDCDAGQGGDQPAHRAPEQQQVDAEIGIDVGEKARLKLAAHRDQERGEGHGDQREDDEQQV